MILNLYIYLIYKMSESRITPKSSKNIITIPKVDKNLEEKGVLTFTLSNTDVSIANSIRRTLVSDIPTVVISKNIVFSKNTTSK